MTSRTTSRATSASSARSTPGSPTLRLPLLVIFGARDQIVDPDAAAGYKRVKGARV